MRALIPFLLTLLLCLPSAALAGEGDPLLSVDDLQTLEGSYTAFLNEVGDANSPWRIQRTTLSSAR